MQRTTRRTSRSPQNLEEAALPFESPMPGSSVAQKTYRASQSPAVMSALRQGALQTPTKASSSRRTSRTPLKTPTTTRSSKGKEKDIGVPVIPLSSPSSLTSRSKEKKEDFSFPARPIPPPPRRQVPPGKTAYTLPSEPSSRKTYMTFFASRAPKHVDAHAFAAAAYNSLTLGATYDPVFQESIDQLLDEVTS